MDLDKINEAQSELETALRSDLRIPAIKAVRALTGGGLREAKAVVDAMFAHINSVEFRSASMQVKVEPEATPNQWAHYIVHSNDGHYDNVVHFKGASWNFDDAMNYAQGRMDDCDEKVTVAKVIATTKRTLVTL